jgi:RHS repeat-associated protein
VNYPAGRHWIGNATFQPLDLATALPAEAPLWFWQSSTQAWRYRLPSALSTASDAPARLEPGEAIFALHTAAFTLAPADPPLEVRYYHQDHLGSSSVMTDATGQLVSESTFYPFGHPRNEHEPRNVKEAYGFTQKERDGESGLSYHEARYVNVTISRFISVDPTGQSDYHSPYAYCRNNPLRLCDPTGFGSEDVNIIYETHIEQNQVEDPTNLLGSIGLAEPTSFSGDDHPSGTSGSSRSRHDISVDPKKCEITSEQKAIGETHKLNNKGQVLERAKATDSSLTATAKKLGNGLCVVSMQGNPTNPLAKIAGFNVAPGITYQATFALTPEGQLQSTKVDHDKFPAHSVIFNGAPIHLWSPQTEGTNPYYLTPVFPNNNEVRPPPPVAPAPPSISPLF